MMEVRIVHMGKDYWLVREQATGRVYSFAAPQGAPYRALGFAAERDYLDRGDLIAVEEADLVLYSKA